MLRHPKILPAPGFGLAAQFSFADAAAPGVARDSVTAVDVALEPDATMMDRARADNGRLLENFPKGFALDDTHHAHVTVLQRFVRTTDLDKVYAAVAAAMATEKPAAWKLQAVKYYYLPMGPIGLAGIVVEPTPDLVALQQMLVDGIAPFAVATGTAAAFFTTEAEPSVGQATIDYIAAFVPDHSGAKFLPHVTVGIGTTAYLDAMLAAPFEPFTFSPADASIYQLGDFGTARKNLKTIEFTP